MKTVITFFFVFILQLCSAQLDDKFYQPKKELKPIENVKYENIDFPVDKDTITAIFLKPTQTKPKVTVLFFHGAGGNVSTYTFMTQPLVEKGFQVVMVDFRGYGKSTGTPTHQNVAEDGQKFFDFISKRNDVKNTKILFYGASLGSQVATHLARTNKDKISGLIIDGGMSSFADIAAVFAPDYKSMLEQMLVSVYSAKEDIKYTKGLPTLFIYSKNDKTVPYSQGEVIYANASEPKQFLEFSADHLEAVKEKPVEVVKAIESLLK
ncbi:alpha/beta hydrolase [Chryseobacterium sp. JUb7]|uniref:alpha/beta hydrolase n=1 Tax=Chryseobacterium sp. JUb7 TaxID=2940599 RepID=UPI002168471B|nr:alpha/beta hydrolase [Chryseobacterium sp. JUb7]MCS3530490.1 pimeloyl-ACP methyl ester carboxylesterase [Chryseobacterium sp. JUb7]